MGRKAARKKVVPIRRIAPTWVTPRLTFGDVLMLIDPDTWLKEGKTLAFRALLYAALAALIACARVKLYQAVDFRLADYRADRLATLNQNGRSYPVVLLPLVIAAIDAYLKQRKRLGIGGDFLFVNEKGGQLGQHMLHRRFATLAAQYGHHGGQVPERLVGFFDEQMEGECRYHLSVIALRRGQNRARDGSPKTRDVLAAAADHKRLRKVLADNHELAGEAGGLRGGHGKTKARKTARLFLHRTFGYRMTPFLRKDSVCARLLTYDWLEGNVKRRKKIIREDLPHLERLLAEKKIRPDDIAYLLCMQNEATQNLLWRRRVARETPEEREKRQETVRRWHERMVEMYRARPPGETPKVFFARMVERKHYPFAMGVFALSLHKAGIAPKQVTRQQKKRLSG
jgi:hypothetical protein